MNIKTKAGASIIVALLALGLIVLANRAIAPETMPEAGAVPAKNTPTVPAPSSATSSPPIKVTARNFTLQLGQPATVDGYKFVLRNIEDSRCPDGVQCIRAGEVKAYLQAEYGTNKKEVMATSDGEWVTIGEKTLRITKVIPSHPTQITGSYIVFLEFKPLK